jgi:hypothetical protein
MVVGKDSRNSPDPTPTNGKGSDFASANDKGPVGIITEDPTCDTWRRINDALAAEEKGVSWPDRDQSVPAAAWNPQQRTMYETVSKAIRGAADQVVGIVKLTPHRVMRELYNQFIAYSQAFVEGVPSYTANDKDRGVASAPDNLGLTLTGVCSAIVTGSAGPIAPLVAAAAAPTEASGTGDPADPQRFLTTSNSVCAEWTSDLAKFFDDTATQWTSDQKAVNAAVVPRMNALADDLEKLGRQSGNATLEDFAVLSAQYWRAYTKALPTYTSSDIYLANAANYSAYVVQVACDVAG